MGQRWDGLPSWTGRAGARHEDLRRPRSRFDQVEGLTGVEPLLHDTRLPQRGGR